jgi:hypothetical protein
LRNERYNSDNEFREKKLKVNGKYKKERYNSDKEFREQYKKISLEYYHRKKAERMQAAAQTELLELK